MENFRIIKPSGFLAPYVKDYWFLTANDLTHPTQRITPTGFVSMMFHREKLMYSNTHKTFQPTSFICGQSTSYSDLIQTGKVDLICVTFRPEGVSAFFNLPVHLFKDQSIDIHSLEDPALRVLEDRIQNTFDDQSCVRMIEETLLKRLRFSKAYNIQRMKTVVQSIHQGQTDVKVLASISCLSYKQFKRVFAENVGVNPKDFLRIIRFQNALHILQNYPNIDLTQLALECGCYDQSHLIKEFKSFSGYTPTQYISIYTPYSDYFS